MYSISYKRILFLISLILMIVVSCGKHREIAINDREITIRPNLNYIRDFSTDETNIGLRICYALKTKRLKYRADLNGQKYRMKSYQKNCSGTKTVDSFETVLNIRESKPMIYETDYKKHHLSEVPTDLNSPMTTICARLFEGELPKNTMQVTPETRVQFEFSNEGEMDFINMHHGIKDSANSALDGYKTMFVTVFGIKTFPESPKLTGVIVDYYRSTPCENTKNQSTIAIGLESGEPSF